MNSDENGVGAINDTYDIVCDLPVQIIDQESLVSTNPMPDTLSKHFPIAANSGVASDNNLLLQNQSDPLDVQSLLIDKCSYNQDYQQGIYISCIILISLIKIINYQDLKTIKKTFVNQSIDKVQA